MPVTKEKLSDLMLLREKFKSKNITGPEYSDYLERFASQNKITRRHLNRLVSEQDKIIEAAKQLVQKRYPESASAELRQLIDSLLDNNLSYPDEDMHFNLDGNDFILTKQNLKILVMLLRYWYNYHKFPGVEEYKLNEYDVLEAKMKAIIYEQMENASRNHNPEALYKLSLSLKCFLNGDLRPHPNRETLINILNEFKPGIPESEIDDLIHRHKPC